MNVNGVTGASELYSTYSAQNTATTTKAAEDTAEKNTSANKIDDVGAIYEVSQEAIEKVETAPVKTYANPDLVAQLKADAEERTSQLKSLVEKLISKQATAFDNANDNIWSMLREGKVEVDAATKAQAQEDISEDGYWGVKQTSDRILDFAQALAGNDPEKLETMREAFKKGYEQAEKTWGGELPEISKNTFDAVMEKFDKLISDINGTSDTQA